MAGYQNFHTDVTLNFMANRMTADIASAELSEFTQRVGSIDDWIEASIVSAENSAKEQRFREAGAYFRAAEFFMPPDHPRKTEAYDQFLINFDRAFPEVADLRTSVPFGDGELAIIDVPAEGEAKDVIVACSGFDGLIEEMYAGVSELAKNGYRVVLYEGPGQGSALRQSHLPMTPDWERPVSKVLDHLKIDSCTLMGMSLGGYLAPRAAAFEPRAKRLIVWGAMHEMADSLCQRLGEETYNGLIGLMDDEQDDIVNQLMTAQMEADPTSRWSITHGIHTCGGKTPFDFIKWMRTVHLKDVSNQITQDTLIVHGSGDHLVDTGQAWTQAAALTNAHSITVRVFSEYEDAAEHCQVSNVAPVYREILNWLHAIDVRDERQK